MTTVTKRDLNQRTSHVLAEVAPGAPVIVTERGEPRWRIEAVDPSSDPVERLRTAGNIDPARPDPAPWPDTTGDEPVDVDALLAESRGDH